MADGCRDAEVVISNKNTSHGPTDSNNTSQEVIENCKECNARMLRNGRVTFWKEKDRGEYPYKSEGKSSSKKHRSNEWRDLEEFDRIQLPGSRDCSPWRVKEQYNYPLFCPFTFLISFLLLLPNFPFRLLITFRFATVPFLQFILAFHCRLIAVLSKTKVQIQKSFAYLEDSK